MLADVKADDACTLAELRLITESNGERTVDEQWMVPRAGSMQGMSRTVRAGKLVAHEAVILRERGELIGLGRPSARPD